MDTHQPATASTSIPNEHKIRPGMVERRAEREEGSFAIKGLRQATTLFI